MRLLGFANEFVGFVLRHLATPDHVLDEVSRAFHRESGETGRGVDDVFHCRRHLAAGFEADLVRARSHFGDGVSDVLPAVSGASARRSSGWSGGFSRGWLRLGKGRFFRHRGGAALPRGAAVVVIEEKPAK